MDIQVETINFFVFVGIGTIFAIIFDFFRAFRKIKKPTNNIVTLQDIIYFLLVGLILIFVVININNEMFRLYLMLAIVLGVIIYVLIIGDIVRDLFIVLINSTGGILEFVFLPVKVQIMFWHKVCKKIKKCVNLCCKKKIDMIEFYHKKMKNVELKERGLKNKRRKRVEK